MQSDRPLVSAIITTYKREASVVERAVLSVLNQSYSNIEVLVVDDNQNQSEFCDKIKQMCEQYPIVRYIKQNGNKGACAARNLGIVNARGEYCGCLDDDDEWKPQKIEKQIAAFENDDDFSIGVVYCNGIIKDVDSGEERPYNRRFKNEVSFLDLLSGDYIGSTSHPLIRKKSALDVGLFWEEQPARQDYEMWIRLSQKYRMVGVSEPLFIHSIHQGEQISKNKKKSWVGYSNIYRRYKKQYRQDRFAEKQILSFILLNRSGISAKVVMLTLRYYWVSLLLKLSGKHQK